MSDFGDWEEADSVDTDEMDLDAVGRIFRRLLQQRFEEGHRREALLGVVLIALIARLKREGVI